MYTDFPKDSIPKEKTRPKSGEYYEWTGFSHLRLDKDGCLQPGKLLPGALIGNICCGGTYFRTTVDKNEAGAFITSNECPPTPYPISAAEAPDITNPYYLVEKSRQKPNPGGTQSFLQPDFNNAELSSDTFAFTEIIDNNIVADAPFSGSDAGFLGPVVANQVAEAPFVDDTFFGWGAPTINVERKLKQRRGIKRRTSLVRAVGDMT